MIRSFLALFQPLRLDDLTSKAPPVGFIGVFVENMQIVDDPFYEGLWKWVPLDSRYAWVPSCDLITLTQIPLSTALKMVPVTPPPSHISYHAAQLVYSDFLNNIKKLDPLTEPSFVYVSYKADVAQVVCITLEAYREFYRLVDKPNETMTIVGYSYSFLEAKHIQGLSTTTRTVIHDELVQALKEANRLHDHESILGQS